MLGVAVTVGQATYPLVLDAHTAVAKRPFTCGMLPRERHFGVRIREDRLMIHASSVSTPLGHFLVVEPDPLFRLLLCVAFAGEFSEFSAVGTFDEARTLLDEQRFTAIVAEYHLPGGTGFTLYREARRSMPNVPFVLMCGGLPVTVPDPCFRFLGKPFDVTEFAETLGQMLAEAADV